MQVAANPSLSQSVRYIYCCPHVSLRPGPPQPLLPPPESLCPCIPIPTRPLPQCSHCSSSSRSSYLTALTRSHCIPSLCGPLSPAPPHHVLASLPIQPQSVLFIGGSELQSIQPAPPCPDPSRHHLCPLDWPYSQDVVRKHTSLPYWLLQ